MFTPDVWGTVGFGNVDIALAAGIAAAFACPRLWPLLTVVGQAKPFALWPVALECLRNRRQIAVTTVVLIAGIVLGAAVCGVESFVLWRQVANHVLTQGNFGRLNWSLSFAVLRLLRAVGIWHYIDGPLPIGPRLYLAAAGILGPAVTVFLTRRMPRLEWYAFSLIAAIFFSPICWSNYVAIAYIYIALRIGRSHFRLTRTIHEPAAVSEERHREVESRSTRE
jgi:hypothetical protein